MPSYGHLKSQDVKNVWHIFRVLLEKRPLSVTFSKFCSESFHRDTDRRVAFKFREIWRTVNRWNRALLTWQRNKTKFHLALQLSLLLGLRPKSARSAPVGRDWGNSGGALGRFGSKTESRRKKGKNVRWDWHISNPHLEILRPSVRISRTAHL